MSFGWWGRWNVGGGDFAAALLGFGVEGTSLLGPSLDAVGLTSGHSTIRKIAACASAAFLGPMAGLPGAGIGMEKSRLSETERLIEKRQPAQALVVLEKLLQRQTDFPGVRYQVNT